jgi:hypothetical protein
MGSAVTSRGLRLVSFAVARNPSDVLNRSEGFPQRYHFLAGSEKIGRADHPRHIRRGWSARFERSLDGA